MKTYSVCITGRANSILLFIREKIVWWHEVEASNKAEAKEKAWEAFKSEGELGSWVYEKKNFKIEVTDIWK